jgi:hypothetical protein
MIDRKSSFRRAAEPLIASVIARAKARQTTAKGLRAMLREAFDALLLNFGSMSPKRPRGVWYAALKDVTGAGVLDLPDHCQVALLRAEKTRPRRTRKEKHVAR